MSLYFKDNKTITVYFSNGDIAVWKSNDPVFNKVLNMCEDNEWIKIETLYNFNRVIMTNNNVQVTSNGNIIVNDLTLKPEDSKLITLIKLLKDKGTIDSEIESIKPFLINCLKNPYIDGVHEIYEFCKNMDFEITEDGCFLAYKNVNKDYSSIYDNGKTKHAIGTYTEVKDFDTNRSRDCSKGLHFCAKSYLNFYSGDTTIIVKVNPEDVVSIPVDYSFTKGRCKRYMMVGVLKNKEDTFETIDVEETTNQTIVNAKKNRIQETADYMNQFNNDVEKVANIMNISIETVKRNMRKFKEKN